MDGDKRPTPTVLAIGQLNFEGHIIPHTWYEHVTYETDGGDMKVDLQAIIILSDIVYWYRPRAVMDEETGKLLGWERRFFGDKLQRNYQQISDQFGLSKTQAARAVKRLRDLGLVTMEFRTVDTAKGPIPNVLYLEPVPERLAEITRERVNISSQICKDTPTNLSTYPHKFVRTNTENTPENTPTKKDIAPAAEPDIQVRGEVTTLFAETPQTGKVTVPLPGTEEPWQGPPPPAAEVFRSRMSRSPKRASYRRIHGTVGDEPEALAFWGEIVAKWRDLGWNPTNVDGMLDCFARRELPKVARGNGKESRQERSSRVLDEARRRYLAPKPPPEPAAVDAEYVIL